MTLSGNGDVMGIDFALPVEGLAYFSVTPCRVLDTRSGPPLATGVVYPLRLEAHCGIPGDAVAVAANVTVTNAAGGGHVAIWPANLTTPPQTSVINVKAGLTRANNAVLTLSRLGLHNFMLRGSLVGGTTFDAIIDVSGYFAQTTTP